MISILLKPSIRLAFLLAAAHCGAIMLILMLHVAGKPVLVVLLLASMIYTILHHALHWLPGSLMSLRIGDKACTLFLRDGRERGFVFLGSTYVSPQLTVLNMKEEGAFFTKSAVILPDAIDPAAFRQLRVWLKWK